MASNFDKQVADLAYNVGFGAKRHFATHDLAEKTPGVVGFLSMAIGIVGLIYEPLSTKAISASLTIAGLIALYCSFYNAENYGKVGTRMTELFNELRRIREDETGATRESLETRVAAIETEFYAISIPRQMLFSDAYAHFKFFFQMNIQWLDRDLQFQFWRDKVPATFKLFLLTSAVGLLGLTTILIIRSYL